MTEPAVPSGTMPQEPFIACLSLLFLDLRGWQRGCGLSPQRHAKACVMTVKNNAEFEEELTCHFKTDMRNLTNFDLNTQKSKKNAL